MLPSSPERRWICLKRLMAHQESKYLVPENSFNLQLDTFQSCLLSVSMRRRVNETDPPNV